MLSFLENVLEVTIAVVLADRIIKHAPDIKAAAIKVKDKVVAKKEEAVAA